MLSGGDTGYRLAEVDEVLGCLVVQVEPGKADSFWCTLKLKIMLLMIALLHMFLNHHASIVICADPAACRYGVLQKGSGSMVLDPDWHTTLLPVL